MQQTIERSLGAMNSTLTSRADADAQTTVTDFLDFTEYLPSDMIRSLTLIGKLDQAYEDASFKIDELTTSWGRLPTLAPADRPSPAQLRADISEKLNRAVSSRVFAHAEAVRMSENVHRHYNKATVLLAKLQTMMENYPTEEQKSPTASRSPQLTRAKLTVRASGEDGQKVRRQRVPRITVPGEVLAPYDIEYDTFSDEDESSSDDESEAPRRTPAPAPRIKLVNKTPKSASRPSRPAQTPVALTAAAAANAAALLQPPPENAVIGSADAPWLQLTDYELAKLRKRMKKNATWTPSETMVARELKLLNRGPDAYREAKKQAEDEGRTFDPTVPAAVDEDESGAPQLPAGAISVDSVAAAEDLPTSNRGMKLNEAKKMKRETLAKLAAEEAEESARKMAEQAKAWLGRGGRAPESSKDAASDKSRPTPRPNNKRRRETESDTNEAQDGTESPSSSVPQIKRTKTETPVLPPQHITLTRSSLKAQDSTPNPALLTPGGTIKSVTPQTETPVPIPIPPQGSSSMGASRSATSPTPSASVPGTVTTTVPIKPPAETPVPLPFMDRRKSVTPVTPPVRETPTREASKRETRGEAAKRTQQPSALQAQQTPIEQPARRSSSRGATPRITPGPDASRRPASRGKAMSQEPPSSLATDRPRRASTARNTPAPEARQPSKRAKRPAPGVVSTTNSGGNSAVGKRKAAPKKKARFTKKEKGQMETEIEEVDDEGNPISAEEPRYCLCNRVSFGTMIQCDNVDVSKTTSSHKCDNILTRKKQNCKQEWFHLECVGLSDIPARTTKWYCPDCRKALNLGEKGEVSARGVRK